MPDDTVQKLKISIMMMCAELMAKNDQHQEMLVFAPEIRKNELTEDVERGLCFMEATSLTKLHQWAKARQKYAECPIKADDDRAMIESNMAELSMIEGDSASAVSMYQASLAHDDTNPHAAFGLAVALAREDQYHEAHQAFLHGVKLDPGFTFLTDAFFEPKSENDFQTACRLLALRRLPEARFYLKRYVELEDRPVYKAQAIKWLQEIQNQNKDIRIAQYPVLLQHVRSMALNHDGSLIAFVTVEKSSEHDFVSALWILDTQNGKTRKRLVLPETVVSDMAFVENTHNLRLLGIGFRYELDVTSQDNAYYLYENANDAFALFLTASGRFVGRLRDDQSVEFSAWNNIDDVKKTIWKSSSDIHQIRISENGQKGGYRTALGVHLGDASAQEERHTLSPKFEIRDMVIHPTKDIFALGMRSGTLLVDSKGNLLEIFGSPGQVPITNVAFSPDGKKLAAYAGQTVEIWNTDHIGLTVPSGEPQKENTL